jgi:alpha-amylase/alpha-mannosidase (GH57 family)
MGNKQFFIHGHFYQPPREDAITGLIPGEPGAAPYKNWNERIHDECYRPNASIGNFSRISFNIGPTLLDWMQGHDKLTYQAIIDQENAIYARYGVGNGMAQPYNHTILPLASTRDKITQIKWGIADFIHHFGHQPLGMWLPETAVDEETLSILADHGIQFTILAPWQVRLDKKDEGFYILNLPGNRQMHAFVYDRGLSTRLSFDPSATVNADQFIRDHLELSVEAQSRVLCAASDGELYGHHQPFREMFLAHLIDRIPVLTDLSVSFPAKILREAEAASLAELVPDTSWSCHHGISRWKEECACTPGAIWKAPLRSALDSIADQVDVIFERVLVDKGIDPFNARNEFIRVLLGETSIDDFLAYECKCQGEDTMMVQALLKAQVARQKMYTSCGFFFDELSRIEPRNNIGYAAQAIAWTEFVTGEQLMPDAWQFLSEIKSQRFAINGWTIFTDFYRNAVIDLQAYAISPGAPPAGEV